MYQNIVPTTVKYNILDIPNICIVLNTLGVIEYTFRLLCTFEIQYNIIVYNSVCAFMINKIEIPILKGGGIR